DRRGRRDGAKREHDLLDAPARDLRGRPGMPLHAGHLARHSRRRRSPRRPPDADLRRDGTLSEQKLSKPVLPGEGASDYERYLRTDELLALQKTSGEWVHRDELLFQTVHQSSELWLKLAVTEVAEATRLIDGGSLGGAIRLLRR